MKPQTEELLYFLLWTADTLLRPTWRKVEDSFESWAWRNGLTRRLAELERQKLIERHPALDVGRIVRLTEAGQQRALGGRNPVACWNRPWDGQWRFVLFDIPAGRDDLRQQFLRLLRRRHFGCLQRSVWTSPDPTDDVRTVLGETRAHPDAFLVMEGKPAAGESDAEVVAAAWDFEAINRRYENYLSAASTIPATGARLVEWARRENAAWKAAVQHDPLLPSVLLPNGYRGTEALRQRKLVFSEIMARPEHTWHG